jgi:hypothetical protein
VPIVTQQLPSEAVEAVRHALSATGRFPRHRGAALSLSSPHPTFAVGLERLVARERLVEAAELIGWRALLEENREVVAAVELPGKEPGKSGALINRGPFVASTLAALGTAERQKRVVSERVELRLLRVNALYVVALWLYGVEAGEDLFIPLSPAPSPLRAGAPYESTPFEEELFEMARGVAEANRAAERPDELGA